jgi:hypothetical protein
LVVADPPVLDASPFAEVVTAPSLAPQPLMTQVNVSKIEKVDGGSIISVPG